ncbi:MAG: metallophosphoesterase family protein [Deltaproteobacteria bacterium]|nr:metallophosphoesterase family protein [Deltaproteobacteria bacterium]
MRVAVLSDIHGNLAALEAVLRDAARRNVEDVLHLGDLVGYGPRPEEVVARVQTEGIPGVVGNYDLAVCHPDAEEGRARYLKASISDAGRRTYLWTREHVGAEARSFLHGLPAQLRVQEGDRVFLFTHGSPERPNEYLLPETPEERLEELFAGTGADVLVVGHTHRPHVREVGTQLLLNPGSVGRPKDGDIRASYLVLDTDAGLRVEQVRVEFDVESVAADSIRSGLPSEQADDLRRGRGV